MIKIYKSKYNNKFKREEELYYYLIDIVRSPEVVKALSGLWVNFIKEDH